MVGIDFEQRLSALPEPQPSGLEDVFDLLVAGVGATGVLTAGALITMAAHLEGKGASVQTAAAVPQSCQDSSGSCLDFQVGNGKVAVFAQFG